MQEGEVDILHWLAEAGLRGDEPNELFRAFCEHCNNIGVSISYAVGLMDTIHPEFEGHAFEWRAQDTGPRPLRTYSSSDNGAAKENWENSVFHYLLTTGESEVRRQVAESHHGVLPVGVGQWVALHPSLREPGGKPVIALPLAAARPGPAAGLVTMRVTTTDFTDDSAIASVEVEV